MEVSAQRHDRLLVASVSGRIDHNSSNAFRDAMAPHLVGCASGQDSVILDLAAMDYISSAGLRVFMIMAREAKARKGRIVLAGLQPLVREIFDISKFTLLFEIFDSVDLARTALAGSSGSTEGL